MDLSVDFCSELPTVTVFTFTIHCSESPTVADFTFTIHSFAREEQEPTLLLGLQCEEKGAIFHAHADPFQGATRFVSGGNPGRDGLEAVVLIV